MEHLVQCPVCTLYLHNGITLETHLDTHPKDQVIRALCSLTTKPGSSYGSRTSTPVNSERSYRSRSRTPATDDSQTDSGRRWTGSQRSDHERYWRNTPSRTPKSTPVSNVSRNVTPDLRMAEIHFETNAVSSFDQPTPYVMKTDNKAHQTFQSSVPLVEFEPQYAYYPDQQEDHKEVKFSRSPEYSAIENPNHLFAYNMPNMAPGVKMQSTLMPGMPRRVNDVVKLLPKPNNILLKSNMGGVQYIGPGGKPVHMVMPTTPTFVQKNVQNNMIMTGNMPSGSMKVETKSVNRKATNQFKQMSGTFTPGTTVVTQNSQIIYREMVHNIDGKPFIPTMHHEHVSNVTQASSMYQNVMVLDPFQNASCMYATPEQLMPKAYTTQVYNSNFPLAGSHHKPLNNSDAKKTLIIEVSPIISETIDISSPPTSFVSSFDSIPKSSTPSSIKNKDFLIEKLERRSLTPNKGLKILSNIKVEVPVQHHKNMVNTVMDLTGNIDCEYNERGSSPEKILPDICTDDTNHMPCDDTHPSISSSDSISNTFAVIKNDGNESNSKSSLVDSKIETEFTDSCPVPDLICNEKPSISPISELSESGDNSIDRTPILSPKLEDKETSKSSLEELKLEEKIEIPIVPYSKNMLRLNNIYVKKNKKVLHIRNAKSFEENSKSKNKIDIGPEPSSSRSKVPENFTMTKLHQPEKPESIEKPEISISVDLVKEKEESDFEVDMEEPAMDEEPPVAASSMSEAFTTSSLSETFATSSMSEAFATTVDMVRVKDEVASNESSHSNQTVPDGELTPVESLRPVNYGNMPAGEFEDESNHKELLDLEAASKNKQFVSMMNENYFGDNIYADYFTPDRVDALDAQKAEALKEGTKDGMYGIWGEPSQKENGTEFVLPNFIHESYKIAESSCVDYAEVQEASGGDSKDVLSESEPSLNICADERMPARGELSGQESNGDTDSWTGMYSSVTPAEPYDLMARESWVSDGSEMDVTEKRESLEEPPPFTKSRSHTCGQCGARFLGARELRAHKTAHVGCRTSYSRLLSARAIKKEDQADNLIPDNLPIDSKESISTSLLQEYNSIEAKPNIEALIKQEPKRRRKDFVCPTCKVDQENDAAFHAHLKIHPLECHSCGKCFFRRANLALHIKTHLGIRNYKCEVCEKRFSTRQKLREHHNVHTGRAPVKCTLCDHTFRRYSNMVQHRNRHHLAKRAKVRDFVCHCGAVFHSRAKLRWHAETHNPRPHACMFCSDKFLHQASLTRHLRRSHNHYFLSPTSSTTTSETIVIPTAKIRLENVTCPICKQVYLRSNLRTHLLTHSGKRPYHCVICNRSFTTKWNLKLHRWTHMSRSSKPFKCTLCKGAFIRHSEFVSHMNAHKSVRPYTCNYCGCQFIRKYNCRRHVREHEMAKKYVCKVPECGKSFHRSYYLTEHMKVHSGARPFSCNICGKTSSNKSNHNKHVKIHHAREPVATEA